MLPSDKQKLE